MNHIEKRLNQLLVALETRELTTAERAELDDLKNRVMDLESRTNADESEAAANTDKAATAPVATRAVRPGAPRSMNYGLSSRGDNNFASWIRAVSPYATDADVRAASRVGPMHGIEMRIDPALAIKSDSGGNHSHLISETFNTSLIEELQYTCPWLGSGATVVNTSTNGLVRIPKVGDIANEGAVISDKVKDSELPPPISEISLDCATITSRMVSVSWEALQDSAINLPQMLAQILGARIGRALDRLISSGGDPAFEGFFKQTLPAGQKQTVATAGKVTVADLIKLIGKLDRAYSGNLGSTNSNLRFIMNSATLTGLLGETATGSGEFLLADPEAGTGARILGIPVLVANFADDNAAGKFPVYLADLGRALYIRQHLTLNLRRSSDFAFDQRSDVFVGVARYGSAIGDGRAVVALEGK